MTTNNPIVSFGHKRNQIAFFIERFNTFWIVNMFIDVCVPIRFIGTFNYFNSILRFKRSKGVGVVLNNVVFSFLSRRGGLDRKSTRLNSSHVRISYAVFCLKKKKK